MNRREGFKAMNVKVIVLPKRNLKYKLKLVLNEDWGKRFVTSKTLLTSSSFSNPLWFAPLC